MATIAIRLGCICMNFWLRDASAFLFLSVLGFLIHVFSPNKYLGYFFYIAFLVRQCVRVAPLNVATKLVQFCSRPNVSIQTCLAKRLTAPHGTGTRFTGCIFCGLLAIFTGDVLASRKTGPLAWQTPKCRSTFSWRMDLSHIICLLRLLPPAAGSGTTRRSESSCWP